MAKYKEEASFQSKFVNFNIYTKNGENIEVTAPRRMT